MRATSGIFTGWEIPGEETYDGYLQLENGVGMVRLFQEEVAQALEEREGDDRKRQLTIATGMLAAPVIEEACGKMKEKYPRVSVNVVPVKNEFFGELITVAGLLTGQDLERQLTGLDLGEELLLTENMMRSGESIFLDDMTPDDLSGALQVPVTIVKSDGIAFLEAVLGGKIE